MNQEAIVIVTLSTVKISCIGKAALSTIENYKNEKKAPQIIIRSTLCFTIFSIYIILLNYLSFDL